MSLPSAVKRYLDDIVRSIAKAVGAKLEGIVLTGSGALADFDPAFSDIDLMVVVDGPLEEREIAQLVAKASQDSIPCPAVGLDLGVYEHLILSHPKLPIRFRYELALESGSSWATRLHPGGAESELALDLAFAREHGRALQGCSPKALISPIPRPWILDAVLAAIRWHESVIYDLFHDPTGSQAVLNTCRGLYYCQHERFVSKSEAANWAESKGWSSASQACAARLKPSRALPRAAIVEFLELAAREVEAAARNARHL